jgi:hypothetical protein
VATVRSAGADIALRVALNGKKNAGRCRRSLFPIQDYIQEVIFSQPWRTAALIFCQVDTPPALG